MLTISANHIQLTIDPKAGAIASLPLRGVERTAEKTPLFRVRLRDRDGASHTFNAAQATEVTLTDGTLCYRGFGEGFEDLRVTVDVTGGEAIAWRPAVTGISRDYAVEWIEGPRVCLPRLADNDPAGGRLLFPHDEGVLIADETKFIRYEPEYPSSGAYVMFPNKMCSPFMSYHFLDAGLYMGAHDPARGLKCVDFYPEGTGVTLAMRLYSGCDYGEDYVSDFPVVWQACESQWQSAAAIYRRWFEANLPANLSLSRDNAALPDWYRDLPLVVTYPVQGVQDYGKMEPNALFPFVNALPHLKRIKEATDTRILALLMHWEGSAPWAPPYVWPPYGGVEGFNRFRDALHERGDLLGVYCSGFAYTLQSTIVESYNMEKEIREKDLLRLMCHSPANRPEKSIICTYQRVGYDICPACPESRPLLDEAYEPVFQSGVDYAQILDQNHGGGQYLCYAREHGHPPMPGRWMTERMTELLADWNRAAPRMLFGCESAAAEPFIGSLPLSDNRYELNYRSGTPVPLYAFLYHPYVRNFMGNQVGCPFVTERDTLRYRLGYSFSAGDLMTLVLEPGGQLMTHWGTTDFVHAPDMTLTLTFIRNLTRFYREEGKKYLTDGRMSERNEAVCETVEIPMRDGLGTARLPRLHISAWESGEGKTAYIAVNPEEKPVSFRIGTATYQAPALSALLVEA